jgi:hypothetical protein
VNQDDSPLEIKLDVPRDNCAGDWIPLQLAMTRPLTFTSSVRIENIRKKASLDVQLNLDMLDRFLEIRPGETYRLKVPIRSAVPQLVDVGLIQVETHDMAKDLPHNTFRARMVPLPSRKLELQPSLARMLDIRIEPICLYDDGTKVHAVLKHIGAETLQNFTLTVMSSQGLRAGKRTLALESFSHGSEEKLDWVVGDSEIELHGKAMVGGRWAEQRWKFPITAPAGQREQRFRFLEPRRLSADLVTVLEQSGGGEEKRAVASEHGVHFLYGHGRYVVEIRPHRADATNVELREVQGQIHVRQCDLQGKVWRFTIDVQMHDLFRKQETLYYDVSVPSETLSGEIPVCLCPPRIKHLQVAGYLGLALTAQGLNAAVRAVYQGEFDPLHVFQEVVVAEHGLNLLYMFSIPIGLVGLMIIDALKYRLNS